MNTTSLSHDSPNKLSLGKQLRVRYIVALSLIACATLAAQFFVHSAIDDASSDGVVINQAGRQRMLSQRITKTSLEILVDSELDKAPVQTDSLLRLSKDVETFKAAHSNLLNGDAAQGIPPLTDPDLLQLFADMEADFFTISAVAQQLIDDPARTLENLDAIADLRQASLDFLPVMHAAVNRMQANSETNILAMQRIETFLGITTILLLLAEALLVFEPAARIIRRKAEDLEQASLQANEASRAKTEFLANMSHEIRTPMTAILGYAELLELEELHPGSTTIEKSDSIASIRRSGKHLLTLINDILDITKIEAGKMQIESIKTDPCDILSSVTSLIRPTVEERGISLVAQFDSKLPKLILSDPLRIRQILMNLVNNASKFTEEGQIKIASRVCGSQDDLSIEFDVTDTGIGMSADQAKRLFNKFEQADSSISRKFGGTGLGLAISKQLAELMGGSLEIVETAPGKGTTFRLTIPVVPDEGGIVWNESPSEAISLSAKDEAEEPSNPLAGKRVLLVEDGPDNRRLISFHIKKAGADIDTAENGQIGVEQWTEHQSTEPYDLILMDMQMPVLDGYSATKALRSKGCSIPIIALTAHAMASDRAKCLEAGCSDYATKPIDRKKLIATCLQGLLEYQTRSQSAA